MPTYSAKCDTCGKHIDYMRSMSDRNDTPTCCDKPMDRTLDAPGGFVDLPAAGKRVWGTPAWHSDSSRGR